MEIEKLYDKIFSWSLVVKATYHLHHTRPNRRNTCTYQSHYHLFIFQSPRSQLTHIYKHKPFTIPAYYFKFLRQSFTMKSQVMESKKPYLAVILIQAIYAGMFLLSKAAFNGGMNNFIFVFYRQAVATLFLAPLSLAFEWWLIFIFSC